MVEARLESLTRPLRRARVARFVEMLHLGPRDIVLDLGSEDGSYLARYYPYPRNIVLADIVEAPMKQGVTRYGLRGYVVLPTDGLIPVDAGAFDAVWCNSVIEHVTVDRNELSRLSSTEFYRRADEHQRRFASEIARVGDRYFVQTPYLHFPIEAHSWLPLVQYFPQPRRYRLSQGLKQIWVKKWRADFLPYDRRRLREHFPHATAFYVERTVGIPKSLIAVRR